MYLILYPYLLKVQRNVPNIISVGAHPRHEHRPPGRDQRARVPHGAPGEPTPERAVGPGGQAPQRDGGSQGQAPGGDWHHATSETSRDFCNVFKFHAYSVK